MDSRKGDEVMYTTVDHTGFGVVDGYRMMNNAEREVKTCIYTKQQKKQLKKIK